MVKSFRGACAAVMTHAIEKFGRVALT